MSEPMYLQGDTIALSNTRYSTQEIQCEECGADNTVNTEEEYSHGETTWYAYWDCWKCGNTTSDEGWY